MDDIRKIRLLIADDHPVVREAIAGMLGGYPDIIVVGQAGTGSQAVELFRVHRPDVVLMDLRVPQRDSARAIAMIRREFGDARIIVFTTYDGDEDIYRALRAGAKAYLVNDISPKQLLECIRAVGGGATYLPPVLAAKLVGRIGTAELTTRELGILRLMAVGKSNKEIAGMLFIADGPVKVHVTNILHKLGVGGRIEAVILALKRGIISID